MTVLVLILVTVHMSIEGIYSYFPLHSLCFFLQARVHFSAI